MESVFDHIYLGIIEDNVAYELVTIFNNIARSGDVTLSFREIVALQEFMEPLKKRDACH